MPGNGYQRNITPKAAWCRPAAILCGQSSFTISWLYGVSRESGSLSNHKYLGYSIRLHECYPTLGFKRSYSHALARMINSGIPAFFSSYGRTSHFIEGQSKRQPDMDSFSCPQSFNISSQQDINASTTGLEHCGFTDVSINIIAPTTDLVFPPGVLVGNISVTNLQDSLDLNLGAIDIVEDLFIENFYNGTLVLPTQVDPRNGTIRSVALTANEPNQRTGDRVDVYGNGTSSWKHVNGSTLSTLHDITHLSVMQIQNARIVSQTLTSVTDLEVDDSLLNTPQLSFIANDATFTNFVFPFFSSQSLQVGGDLTVRHKVNFDSDVDPQGGSLDFDWDVEFVRGNFAIQDWSNATLRLPMLTEVRKQLSVYDSDNATFIFSALTSVGNLTMENNGESVLPGDFRKLEFADSILLRGKIDTSSFGNLFPSLKHVKQSVTIEASNSDFNCSYLASQQSRGLIGQLNCNGLDGEGSDTSPSTATRSGVSRSVWVGVGMAVAIAVLSNS